MYTKIKINNQHIMKYVKNGAYDKFNVEKNDIKMDYILTEKIFKKI